MAAQGGHLDTLKFARKHGCPWNWKTTAYAAGGGHLEVLKWAYVQGSEESGIGLVRDIWQNGDEDDNRTCECAAAKGQLEVLQWLRNSGPGAHKYYDKRAIWGAYQARMYDRIAWDSRTWRAARGHTEVEQWLVANGCQDTSSQDS